MANTGLESSNWLEKEAYCILYIVAICGKTLLSLAFILSLITTYIIREHIDDWALLK